MAKYLATKSYEIEIENGDLVEQKLLELETSLGDLLDNITNQVDAGDPIGRLYLIKGSQIGHPDQVAYWWDESDYDESDVLQTVMSIRYEAKVTDFKFD